MPARSKAKTDILITVAAGIFATHTRDAKEIGILLNTSERSVHRWAETDIWDTVLETLNYEGERNFRVKSNRDSQREAGELFEKAREAYQAAIRSGQPAHKLASSASSAVGLPAQRIHYWAMTHNWRENL